MYIRWMCHFIILFTIHATKSSSDLILCRIFGGGLGPTALRDSNMIVSKIAKKRVFRSTKTLNSSKIRLFRAFCDCSNVSNKTFCKTSFEFITSVDME